MFLFKSMYIDLLFTKQRFDFPFHHKFKVVQEYERAVIFRLGRILANGARGK